MASSDLSLSAVKLNIGPHLSTLVHENINLMFSFETNRLHLKQSPELDSSGCYAAYIIDLADLRHHGWEWKEEEWVTVHLEAQNFIQCKAVLPSDVESSGMQDCEATLSMCCSIFEERILPKTTLDLIIPNNTESKEDIDLLLERIDQASSSVSSRQSSDQVSGVSGESLKFSEEDFIFLESYGDGSTSLTVPDETTGESLKSIWYDYHQVETAAPKRNKTIVPGQFSHQKFYKLNALGNIQQPMRALVKRKTPGAPKPRITVDTSAQVQIQDNDALRSQQVANVKEFFSDRNGDVNGKMRASMSLNEWKVYAASKNITGSGNTKVSAPLNAPRAPQAIRSEHKMGSYHFRSNTLAMKNSSHPAPAVPINHAARQGMFKRVSEALSNADILAAIERSIKPAEPNIEVEEPNPKRGGALFNDFAMREFKKEMALLQPQDTESGT